MTVEQTLRRVDADLAEGRVLPALGRLGNLQRAFPDRLDVRELLAVTYRGQGEAAQAGRWSYLDESPDPDEVAAFERQFRTASGRLQALRWTGDDTTLAPGAAARLGNLRAEAAAERQVDDEADDSGFEWGCAVAATIALTAAALLVIGVVTVVGWFVG